MYHSVFHSHVHLYSALIELIMFLSSARNANNEICEYMRRYWLCIATLRHLHKAPDTLSKSVRNVEDVL